MSLVRRGVILLMTLLITGVAGSAGHAQAPRTPADKTHVRVPDQEPRSADVATLDGILAAFYEVISGPAGQPRDWARDRTLYLPGARFVMVERSAPGAAPEVVVVDHQQFVDRVNDFMVREGFFEREIHRVTESFGAVTHVWSTYEWRTGKPDAPVGGRGVNSIQLVNDGKRWWITAAQWDGETPENPLPARFLP